VDATSGAIPLERGVWGVLATPFHADDRIDTASLVRQVELFARVGARGVVALGVFGEAARLDADERAEVAAAALTASRRLGLGAVIGITALDREQVIAEAEAAATIARSLGPDAEGGTGIGPDSLLRGLMVQVPSADPRHLTEHLTAVHLATGIGIVVQDYPRASGVTIAPDRLAQAVAPLPFVVAVKVESAPTALAVAVLADGCDAPLFGGLGGVGLIDELGAGAAGAMTGFSFPEGLVATLRAFEDSGIDAAREVWSRWLPLAVFEQQEGLALAIRKEVLRRRGVISDARVRRPGAPFPTALDGLLTSHLAAARLLLPAADQ